MGIFSFCAPRSAMTYQSRLDRTSDELVGLCRGLLADGHLDRMEATFLRDWLERNREFAREYPFNVLLQRLSDALVDGVLDDDEEASLLEAVAKLVGGERDLPGVASASTALPLDDPAPRIEFQGSIVVVTGTFAYGPRRLVVETMEERGALVRPSVSKSTRYLVVGEIGSRDWIHSSYGRKIEQAVRLRSESVPLAIVGERAWAAQV